VTVPTQDGTVPIPLGLGSPYDMGQSRTVADRGWDVDDAPYTGDLDLGAVSTRDDLAALLRTVHIRADKPSLRTLEARTRHTTAPLSKAAVAEMLNGVRFPRKAVMVAFLGACGVKDDSVELWRRTWERVAEGEKRAASPESAGATAGVGHAVMAGHPAQERHDTSAAGRTKRAHGDRQAGGNTRSADPTSMGQLRDQVKRLNNDNERLRAQLAVTQRQTMAPIQPADATGGQRPRSPVVSGRELGILLRALREEMGMTVEQVAEHLLCSPTKVKRMETGFRSGTVRDVRDLCSLYVLTETTRRDHLMELARQSKQQGWWQSYGWSFFTYVGLEADASSIKDFTFSVVPGLMQTADYARALLVSLIPEISPDGIERYVETRLIRQRRLDEIDSLRVWSVVDEATLHRIVGGTDVMRTQLDRLIEISALPNVTIQVIPFEAGAHAALESNFVILDFAVPVNSIVFVEGLLGDFYLDRPQDIERYQLVFEALRVKALSQQESIRKIADARKGLKR